MNSPYLLVHKNARIHIDRHINRCTQSEAKVPRCSKGKLGTEPPARFPSPLGQGYGERRRRGSFSRCVIRADTQTHTTLLFSCCMFFLFERPKRIPQGHSFHGPSFYDPTNARTASVLRLKRANVVLLESRAPDPF